MSIGQNLKKYRQAKNISQQKLAFSCNVAISTIQKIEQGMHKNPSLDILIAISKALDVKIDDLIK